MIAALDQTTGHLIPLERADVQSKVKGSLSGKFTGIGTAKSWLEIDNEHSPVRFKLGQQPYLIIRVADIHQDPSHSISITPFESKGNKRIYDTANVNAIGHVKFRDGVNTKIVISKYGESSLAVKIVDQLPVGEYCFRHADSASYFCFGIDPPDSNSTNGGTLIDAKYVHEKSFSNYIVLSSDGTFRGQESGKNLVGRYRIDGNKLIFIGREKEAVVGEINGDVITDKDGDRWIKQNSQAVTSNPSEEILTNIDIIRMAEAKLSDDIIINKIRNSTCKFDVSTNGLIELKKVGVSDAVIKVMTEAQLK